MMGHSHHPGMATDFSDVQHTSSQLDAAFVDEDRWCQLRQPDRVNGCHLAGVIACCVYQVTKHDAACLFAAQHRGGVDADCLAAGHHLVCACRYVEVIPILSFAMLTAISL